MRIVHFGLAIVVACGVASCAARDVSRADAGISAGVVSSRESQVTEQATALRDLTAEMLRKSTIKGAALGAALGCGLSSVVGDSGCLQAAVVGGAIGGIAGHAQGKRQIAKQIEIIAPSAVLPAISRARDQMRRVATDVPTLVAAQDAELADLRQQVAKGALPQATYDARLTAIRQTRSDLAAALLASGEQTRATRDAMVAARDQGQEGLDWYLSATEELERQVISTRSNITLL